MTFIETLLFGQGIRSLKPGLLLYNEVREHSEYRFTRRALYPPDGDPTHTETDIMRVACETPAPVTGGLVCELKAKGEEESAHKFHKGLAVAQQLQIGRVVSKIDSDGAVFAGPFGCCTHVSPPGHQVSSVDETRWGEHTAISRLI
jgi:hypothetical protein